MNPAVCLPAKCPTGTVQFGRTRGRTETPPPHTGVSHATPSSEVCVPVASWCAAATSLQRGDAAFNTTLSLTNPLPEAPSGETTNTPQRGKPPSRGPLGCSPQTRHNEVTRGPLNTPSTRATSCGTQTQSLSCAHRRPGCPPPSQTKITNGPRILQEGPKFPDVTKTHTPFPRVPALRHTSTTSSEVCVPGWTL